MSDIKLSHIDRDGRVLMVDVSSKEETLRLAVAHGRILMNAMALEAAVSGQGAKGNVITTAEIAGIMAAKKTSDLIPMCHPLPVSKVKVFIEPLSDRSGLNIRAEVGLKGQTGVEMEALTAVSVACLTLYDMLKAVDKSMRIEGIELLRKEGGKSGTYVRSE